MSDSAAIRSRVHFALALLACVALLCALSSRTLAIGNRPEMQTHSRELLNAATYNPGSFYPGYTIGFEFKGPRKTLRVAALSSPIHHHLRRHGRFAGRRNRLMLALRAGVLYFALVFAAGFALGLVRISWAVPRLGTRVAELLEMPIMFVVIIFAARWIVRYLAVPARPPIRIAMGTVGVLLMLVTEFALVPRLRSVSINQYLTSRDRVSVTVYYMMLAVFAVMPVLTGLR